MSSQNLNESRFLVEEVNVDEEPTQQQIFDRAEELEIDDLFLAKESLTKQLGSEWKPYCNRKKNIYYINLRQRKAYMDHPIDMQYKIKYAKKNLLAVPRFPSVKVEEIAKSMHLVEEQIRKYQQQLQHDIHLNIVYQEPSEEEESSKKSLNKKSQQKQVYEEQQELNTADLQEFLRFKRELQNEYDQKIESKRKEYKLKLQRLQFEHQNSIRRIRNRAIRELQEEYEVEIRKKNELDMLKQKNKIDSEYNERKEELSQNMMKCKQLQNGLQIKKSNIQGLIKERREYIRYNKLQAQAEETQMYRNQQINNLIHSLVQELQQKMNVLVGGSKFYQSVLQTQLQSLFPQGKPKRKNIFRKNRDSLHTIDINAQNNINKPTLNDFNYSQLENRIKHEDVWTKYETSDFPNTFTKSSLNLRLWMRVL